MVQHYTCPNCAASMVFDADSGMLACHSCGREDRIEDFPKEFIELKNEAQEEASEHEEETKEYLCNNCGAVLITSADTAATNCSFCRSSVVITDRLAGDLTPAKVLPFKISREKAVEAFKKWCGISLLMPDELIEAKKLKKIEGIYVPFWLYHMNSKVYVKAVGTKVRTYSQGDYIYTETKYYDLIREMDLYYSNVPVDASIKMNDTLMDQLEPFPVEELKEFKTPYLAGYLAEKYNYTDEELLPRVTGRVNEYIEKYVRGNLGKYSSIRYIDKNIDLNNENSEYVLLPVWMVYHDYKDAEYIFAMNGQTGKVVGKPPISMKKASIWFGGIAIGTLLVLKTVSAYLGGGFF